METLENIAFAPGVNKKNLEGTAVEISVSNKLSTDIFMAWQHPDHTNLRKQHGMHAEPMIILAGETSPISSHHRHGFYIWDAVEGPVAPLYREGAEKRWIRYVRADAYLGKNTVVVDLSLLVVIVNLGPLDSEVFLIRSSTTSSSSPELEAQGVVQGRGGSLSLRAYDGNTFKIHVNGTTKRFTVWRAGGDPQLLSVGELSEEQTENKYDEL